MRCLNPMFWDWLNMLWCPEIPKLRYGWNKKHLTPKQNSIISKHGIFECVVWIQCFEIDFINDDVLRLMLLRLEIPKLGYRWNKKHLTPKQSRIISKHGIFACIVWMQCFEIDFICDDVLKLLTWIWVK
jgi:hypothetical protein